MRAVWTAALLLPGALAGCHGGSTAEPATPPSSVAAFPRPPHVTGPFPVTLQPGLRLVGTSTCTPAAEVYCLGDEGYRALGEHVTATVQQVVTRPSGDHGSWRTVVRFAPSTRDAVRSAAGTAEGLGGAVVVLRGRVPVAVVPPPDVQVRHGRPSLWFLGLEKAEAWALVDAFGTS